MVSYHVSRRSSRKLSTKRLRWKAKGGHVGKKSKLKIKACERTPPMNKQSSEPGPSSGGEPSTEEDDRWRDLLQSGDVLFYLYIDGLCKDYRYQNDDALKRYGLEDVLKVLMLWGMYPRRSDIRKIVVDHERFEPVKVYKSDIYPLVRQIFPNADRVQMDVYWREFMDLCSEFVFPL
ncbi:uncharacterized protein LOC141850423 [Brevipalpus obovatus]|uniref:uncharacterized protein LOC141850423 n=1 Tax=Brevipalpus obovatus TaxID=246614 RepID=UPI003D9F40CC